ncbi:putative DNA helicase [Helianthus annuus]|nr:putative DNA helicase [Helianthus annuus]
MIESERLFFIRGHQKNLRCETFENLKNVKNGGGLNGSNVGTPVILPSSFTGGARYMMQNYLDAISLFVYTVEFQKCGLPHAHVCLFMHPDDKVPTVDKIDPVICAEIPDEIEDPELYLLVKEHMMHGPCGADNFNSPCMIDGKCSKKFPKKFLEHTSIDSNGFPMYRRRDSGKEIYKYDVRMDNRNVVPYNKTLLKRYQAHINVEWCNQAGSIKYLFKYINKGPDRATLLLKQGNNDDPLNEDTDEIKEYYDCRYVSACEASWRIFSYDVHYRTPSVIRLPFHLPGQQNVVYGAEEDIDDVFSKPSIASTMFLKWMEANATYPEAQHLTYVEFPTKFVWKLERKSWERRERGFSIGRIHVVSPALGEAYFLRILLNKVKGPRSFVEILTVNKQICKTFREACYKRGLLEDDTEYIEAIQEASHSGSGYFLRSLFSTMLLNETLSRPEFVWQKTWQFLSDDILYKQQMLLKSPELSLTDNQIKNLTLFEIERILLRNNSTLKKFPAMPFPDSDFVSNCNNRLITEELSYDIDNLKTDVVTLISALTDEQRHVYDNIMTSVTRNKGGVFFVYGYGGTGKTYLWKTLSTVLRSKGEIVLNVASSGIASLLLTGGRTAHSRFSIPLNLTEDSMCFIKPNSDAAELLKKASLIIWDEAPMTHKHAFEALNRTMNDILISGNHSSSNIMFGGKVVVFGGDFRQILHVVQNGSRHDIVNASLCSSYIWSNVKVLRLTKNMRLSLGIDSTNIKETTAFSNWLLDIGEGKVGEANDGESTIDIPEDLLIGDSSDPIIDLINFVYPSILDRFHEPNYFDDRAILAPTNEVVQSINDRLMSLFPGDEKEYLSSDSICQSDHVNETFDEKLYSPDVLNGLKLSGVPNHQLVLKVGVPIMLL